MGTELAEPLRSDIYSKLLYFSFLGGSLRLLTFIKQKKRTCERQDKKEERSCGETEGHNTALPEVSTDVLRYPILFLQFPISLHINASLGGLGPQIPSGYIYGSIRPTAFYTSPLTSLNFLLYCFSIRAMSNRHFPSTIQVGLRCIRFCM